MQPNKTTVPSRCKCRGVKKINIMNAQEIFNNFMWLVSDGILTVEQYRANMDILGKRLTDKGIFIGWLTDVQIIDLSLKNKIK